MGFVGSFWGNERIMMSRRRVSTVCMAKRGKNMSKKSSGKGFDRRKVPEREVGKERKSSAGSDAVQRVDKIVVNKEVDENGIPIGFVPQGPTMKKYYEQTGRISMDMDPNANLLPELVAQRMSVRMAWLCGVPFTFAILGFAVFFYMKTKYDITFQPAVVATSTLGMFGVSLVGLTYGESILLTAYKHQLEERNQKNGKKCCHRNHFLTCSFLPFWIGVVLSGFHFLCGFEPCRLSTLGGSQRCLR